MLLRESSLQALATLLHSYSRYFLLGCWLRLTCLIALQYLTNSRPLAVRILAVQF